MPGPCGGGQRGHPGKAGMGHGGHGGAFCHPSFVTRAHQSERSCLEREGAGQGSRQALQRCPLRPPEPGTAPRGRSGMRRPGILHPSAWLPGEDAGAGDGKHKGAARPLRGPAGGDGVRATPGMRREWPGALLPGEHPKASGAPRLPKERGHSQCGEPWEGQGLLSPLHGGSGDLPGWIFDNGRESWIP